MLHLFITLESSLVPLFLHAGKYRVFSLKIGCLLECWIVKLMYSSLRDFKRDEEEVWGGISCISTFPKALTNQVHERLVAMSVTFSLDT